MSTVIKVEALGKKYVIYHEGRERYVALRDVLTNSVKKIGSKIIHPFQVNIDHTEKKEEFWTLKDVSFEVKQGERIGIIGRNGAGKSTLLKLLSRITEPTEGKMRITGRVASLLEVGTGFHPELTGKENIFLNGAILGMSRAEINKKFDEIVDFAEVGKFLDTPVKRYSSGMQVRLAFAVAAHLEPEILLVDEVLAVGDIAFQKKCLGKMEEVASGGRTVLFVSHNMGAISTLCSRCILLNEGILHAEGKTSEVLLKYYSLSGSISSSLVEYELNNRCYGDDLASMIEGKIVNTQGEIITEATIHDDIIVSLKYRIKKNSEAAVVPNFHVKTAEGAYAFCLGSPGVVPLPVGIYETTMLIPGDLLNDGTYYVGLALTTYFKTGSHVNCWDENALSFVVVDPQGESSNRYGYTGKIPGPVRPTLKWTHMEVNR